MEHRKFLSGPVFARFCADIDSLNESLCETENLCNVPDIMAMDDVPFVQLRDGAGSQTDLQLLMQLSNSNLISSTHKMTKPEAQKIKWLALVKAPSAVHPEDFGKVGWICNAEAKWCFADFHGLNAYAKAFVIDYFKCQGVDTDKFLREAPSGACYHIATLKTFYSFLSLSSDDEDAGSGKKPRKKSRNTVAEPTMTMLWDNRLKIEGVTEFFEQMLMSGNHRQSDLECILKLDSVRLFISALSANSKIVFQ